MKLPPSIVVQLIHIQGPMKGEIQEFTGNVISIGRHPSCHLRFPSDLTVLSRKHSEILREGNLFKLVDHSTNGTFVNGKKVTEAFLKGGDVLEFSEGGPKVSFLTEMREGVAEPVPRPPPPPAPARPVAPEPSPVEPPAPRRAAVPAASPRASAPPSARAPSEGPVPTVKVPLVIQYGPMLKSYREVPVTIGKHPRCQFTIDHPAILDQHAQIFFVNEQYWVKDLTGQRLVEINRQPVNVQAPLSLNDELALSPKGPVFRFLGEGRLAEASEPSGETPPKGTQKPPDAGRRPGPPEKDPKGGVFSRFRKLID
jgi:pSer/pThr/pTyr-binding forkhead associated (FHA) protein